MVFQPAAEPLIFIASQAKSMLKYKNMKTNNPPTATRLQLYRVDKKAVYFIRFIFEAYDGIAMFETIDPCAASIALHVAPGCESDVAALISDLKRDYRIEPVGEAGDAV